MKTLTTIIIAAIAIATLSFGNEVTLTLGEEELHGAGHIQALENERAEKEHAAAQRKAKRAHETAEAKKPEAERVAFEPSAFVPLTVEEALQAWASRILRQEAAERDRQRIAEVGEELLNLPFAGRKQALETLEPAVGAEIERSKTAAEE